MYIVEDLIYVYELCMFNVERINNERDILGIYCVVDFIVFIEKIILLINYFIIVRYVLNFKLD